MTSHRSFTCVALLLLTNISLGQQARSPVMEQVAPFLHEHAIAVAHVDLQRLDFDAFEQLVTELMTARGERPPALADRLNEIRTRRQQLVEAGARHLFVLFGLADFPTPGPIVVMPAASQDQANRIAAVYTSFSKAGTGSQNKVAVIRQAVVVGLPAAIEPINGREPVARPELHSAMLAVGDSAAHLLIAPSDDDRRVLREMLPPLPQELDGVSGGDLAKSVRWIALGVDVSPRRKLDLVLQSIDATSATSLRGVLADGYEWLQKLPSIREEIPRIGDLLARLTPMLDGDRLVLHVNDEQGDIREVLEMLQVPIQRARNAASRQASTNNLKQLALAMHNYYDTHKHFPTQASYDQEGKPLLSWRVQLLPYLEQEALYKEFHLNEPWDSEHNRKLIDRMPETLNNPGMLLERGKTAYLALTGEQALFRSKAPLTFRDIVDGTSNTIMFVEALPNRAVIWTKPEDLPFDSRQPRQGLLDDDRPGFLVVLCDGAALYVRSDVSDKRLRLMASYDDREPLPDR